MLQRTLTAAVLLAIAVPGFFLPQVRFLPVLLLVFFGVVCVFELAAMFRPRATHIARRIAVATVLALCAAAIWNRLDLAAYIVGVSGCAAFAWRMTREDSENAWGDVAATIGAGSYVGLPMAYLLQMFLASDASRHWLMLMLLVVWGTDTLAYFVGRSMGRRKLIPRLSPKKTVEGSLGGVAGSLLPMLLVFAFPADIGAANLVELAVVCVATGVCVQVGDLAESMIKRDAGAKDSGTLLKGHGGVLDRLDSILFATVPFALYLHLARPEIFA